MFQVQLDELYPMVQLDFYVSNYFHRKLHKPVFYFKNRGKDTGDRFRKLFQMFHLCSKYNSTSSIQWYHQISKMSYSSTEHTLNTPINCIFY
jgi:hypothetical protein